VLSVAAFHIRFTVVGDDGFPVSPLGVDGAAVSIVQVKDTGAGLGPLGTVVATVNVWLPGVRALRVAGLVHADDAPLSSVQVNVAPAAVLWNAKVAVVAFVSAAGLLSMVVVGTELVVYVWTSNVRPSSSVGVTVTVLPAT